MRKTIFLVAAILLLSVSAQAGYYKAVLVMLRAEKNRIQNYEKKGDPASANQLREEVKKIMTATIKDYTDHFNYCPVYYFIDSNLYLVKEGKLDGVILDKNLQPLATPPVRFEDKNYLIAFYGKPDGMMSNTGETSTDGKPVYQEPYVPEPGLVVVSPAFQRMPGRHPFYKFKTPMFLKFDHPPYLYESQQFNIDYKPYAEVLQKELDDIPDKYFKK